MHRGRLMRGLLREICCIEQESNRKVCLAVLATARQLSTVACEHDIVLTISALGRRMTERRRGQMQPR